MYTKKYIYSIMKTEDTEDTEVLGGQRVKPSKIRARYSASTDL